MEWKCLFIRRFRVDRLTTARPGDVECPNRDSTDTICIGMKCTFAIVVCIALVGAASCARRPAPARIVFAPSAEQPVPASSTAAAGALVVAEPQPPEPDQEPAAPAPESSEKPRTKPRVRLTVPDPSIEADPEPAPVADVPILEPREGAAAQSAQRQQAAQLQDQIRARIARLDKPGLSAEERRMLTDARTFLSQSEHALAANDFQRALTLAHKASMLLAVIEQQ
jgi:hypothetical protein